MEFAVWIIAALLLLLLVFLYFMHHDLSSITEQHTHTMIWLEKIESKLNEVEKLLKEVRDEARTRHVR
jgi:hypothetical protein